MNRKTPRGVRIISFLNVFVFGLLPLSASLFVLFSPSRMTEMLSLFAQVDSVFKNLAEKQLRFLLLAQIGIGLVYFMTGLALMRGREKGRRATVALALAFLFLVLISVIINPAAVSQAVTNAVYPGIIIFYLTNKNVEQWFKEKAEITNTK